MPNIDVRKWYIAQNNKIPDMIDKTKSIEEQAKQAFELRNKHKFQARELMKDQEARKYLDEKEPIETFEGLIKRKMKDKGFTREETLKDILKTATKARKKVNKSLGLEEQWCTATQFVMCQIKNFLKSNVKHLKKIYLT